MVCRVRDPAWLLDRTESLRRRNAFKLPGIFSYEPTGTIHDRAEPLAGSCGMRGFALSALREAIFGPHADRVALVRDEILSANQLGALKGIYTFLDEPLLAHDPNKAPACYGMYEFDRRLSVPGRHDVSSKVPHIARATRQPTDIFRFHAENAFWQDLADLSVDRARRLSVGQWFLAVLQLARGVWGRAHACRAAKQVLGARALEPVGGRAGRR